MRKVHRLLFALHAFVGVGAVAGGLAAITNPLEPLGVPIELLKNSPFNDYLIPGIILFSVLGIGNIISAITLHFKFRFQGYLSSVFSWALVIWIIVQCIMLSNVVFLHILYFVIGLIQVILSTIILFEQNLFPTNLVLSFISKLKRNY